MKTIDSHEVIARVLSPDMPAGTPEYPEAPEYQQEAMMQWHIFWAAHQAIDGTIRSDVTYASLALGRFRAAVLTGRRSNAFGRAMVRAAGFEGRPEFEGNVVSAVQDARMNMLSLMTYLNYDDLQEQLLAEEDGGSNVEEALRLQRMRMMRFI
ncbi:MAG: hypothetical protein HYV02_02220 [Deltaproteobacteria bacterium]|nr:hypothetical protein [Deltaproteobacteria bacterium]